MKPTRILERQIGWEKRLARLLPLLGHRNWIVIADGAYPLHSNSGIDTLATGQDQLEVVKTVLGRLGKACHIRPVVHLDAELPFVLEKDARGITAYRDALFAWLKDCPTVFLPHEAIISKLDQAGETFRILILKTHLTLPYTSVFVQLDCGYWTAEAEKRLRGLIKQANGTGHAKGQP